MSSYLPCRILRRQQSRVPGLAGSVQIPSEAMINGLWASMRRMKNHFQSSSWFKPSSLSTNSCAVHSSSCRLLVAARTNVLSQLISATTALVARASYEHQILMRNRYLIGSDNAKQEGTNRIHSQVWSFMQHSATTSQQGKCLHYNCDSSCSHFFSPHLLIEAATLEIQSTDQPRPMKYERQPAQSPSWENGYETRIFMLPPA
jgi:hypothetical protein